MLNKIIYVQGSNAFGGLEKITQVYESTFRKYNPLVVILQYLDNGLDYKNFHKFRRKNRISFILEYYQFIRERKNSIFHLQSGGTHVLLLTYVSGARKIIYHFHGTKFSNKVIHKLIWKFLERRVVIVANSYYTREIILKKLKVNSNLVVIPNLINTNEFKFLERKYNNGKFIVTFAGRFTKGKNIDLILKSAVELINYYPNFEFLLVGDGPEKESIENKIIEYSIGSFVKILPFTEQILKIYYNSHLFLFMSRYESFGNVVAESILTGLPVLCLRIPALTEIIKDEIFLIEKEDPKLIAERIVFIMKNYISVIEKLKKLNENLMEYLNNEKILKKLDSIYRSL